MIEVRSEIVIDRPVEEVFDFVSDMENDPIWCPNVAETTKSAGSGRGVGTMYQFFAKPGPLVKEIGTYTIVAYERPTRMAFEAWANVGTGDDSYVLTSEGGRTRFINEERLSFSGPYRLLEPLLRLAIQRTLDRQLKRLKQHLEVQRRLSS